MPLKVKNESFSRLPYTTAPKPSTNWDEILIETITCIIQVKKESYSRLPYHCFMNVSTFAITCFVSHNLFTTAIVCGKESFCSERLVTSPGLSIPILFFCQA